MRHKTASSKQTHWTTLEVDDLFLLGPSDTVISPEKAAERSVKNALKKNEQQIKALLALALADR